jgi:hypothetical protein
MTYPAFIIMEIGPAHIDKRNALDNIVVRARDGEDDLHIADRFAMKLYHHAPCCT